MIKLRWSIDWTDRIGGFNSRYYQQHGKDSRYLDADYWDSFRAWIELTYRCRWETNNIARVQYLIFDRDCDATVFLLEWS